MFVATLECSQLAMLASRRATLALSSIWLGSITKGGRQGYLGPRSVRENGVVGDRESATDTPMQKQAMLSKIDKYILKS